MAEGIAKKRICVVGVGALGSHVVYSLRNVGDISIVDYDRIESKNILSQLHAKAHVGKNKAEALKQTLDFLFGIKLKAFPHKLEATNVSTILKPSSYDLIIDCVDNGETRRLIRAHALNNTIPCLHGGLAANGEFGVAMWTELFKPDDSPVSAAATCEDGGFLPFISIVSSYIAQSAKLFLDKHIKYSYQITAQSGTIRIG